MHPEISSKDLTTTWFALVLVLDEIIAGNIEREHETTVRSALRVLLKTRCPVEYEKRIERIRQIIKAERIQDGIQNREEFYSETLKFAKQLTEKLYGIA